MNLFKCSPRSGLSTQGLLLLGVLSTPLVTDANAAPQVSRLTPPSELFSTGQPTPIIARFLPGQLFDLQATITPDEASQRITNVTFSINGKPIPTPPSLRECAQGCLKHLPTNASIATLRGVSFNKTGKHTFSVKAVQSDQQTIEANGNFEIVELSTGGKKVKNLIFMLGDGMGAAHRTAARIVQSGYAQGKSVAPLAMDSLPVTGIVKTASLNSIVTDSAPGMSSYVSGNKNNNNEEGVFPDDTTDPFDNPRIEYLSQYLHRTQGKALGLVTTADVFDATPAANAIHTSNRGAGTGIVDQYLDDRSLTGLSVLMGGGRKWFLPAGTTGSARSKNNDYAFSNSDAHTGNIVRHWKTSPGNIDPQRDLIADFKAAGFNYVSTNSEMNKLPANTDKLLGLFSYSNMNVALDKIQGRRAGSNSATNSVVADYGFPDQPMLDEMAGKALDVLKRQKQGFVLMIEGASIDKQAHNMDSERWILDTMEFDRAVAVAKAFAKADGNTLVIVTADHECSGAALIGASKLSDENLKMTYELRKKQEGKTDSLRTSVVGIYEQAGFPKYKTLQDGYPETTDVDQRLLIGYGANADRHENWRTNPKPLKDSQQPLGKQTPLNLYPANAIERDSEDGELLEGHVHGDSAAHTASDVPLSAFGPGAYDFTGTMDNTDVFFKIAQLMVRGIAKQAR
jgi:alkaline phosphatase